MKEIPEKEVARDLQRLRCRRLRVLIGCFGLLLIPAVVLWLVNVELALRVVAPGFVLLSVVIPDVLWPGLMALSADLSSVSTLVPVLLLWFPLWQGRKILRAGGDAEASYRYGLEAYPAHFTFFLVMLGLAGTLYGLLLGLSVSGLSGVVDGVPSAEDLPAVLERLMAGTATALLSSLVGLAGAFLAARPLSALFSWAVAIESFEDDISIEETVEQLRQRLSALSVAVGQFSEQIGGTGLQQALDHLAQLEASQARSAAALSACQAQVEVLARGQAELVRAVAPVAGLVPLVRDMAEAAGSLSERLEGLPQMQQQLLRTTTELLDVNRAGQQRSEKLATVLEEDVQRRKQDAVRERARLQRALRSFAEDERPLGGESDGSIPAKR